MLERCVRGFSGTETERDGIEIRLENGLQDVLHGRLNDPICDGGNTEGAKLSRLPGFGNENPPNGTRGEVAGSQSFPKSPDEVVHSIVPEHAPHRHPIYTGSASPLVAGDPCQSDPKSSEVRHQSPESAEHVVGMCLASRVQLALRWGLPVAMAAVITEA